MLSEEDIKQRFLPFLKEFYKYRYEYRPESLHSELDNVSAGGLIADGMLSFRKNDGAAFVCTYEATSVDKAEEVKFSLNVPYFTWDCLAFGALVATGAYAAAYTTRLSWLVGLQASGNAGFVLGMGVIGFFSWYFLMRQWRKYRYIYAIEQFKQYFADEQWIALAEDVFPAPTDPYLLELKEQCVYNGFGLALVPVRGEIQVKCTPSRLGLYGKDRKMAHWVTRLEWYQAMSQNASALGRYTPTVPDALRQWWNKRTRPIRYLLIDPVKNSIWKAFSRPLGNTSSSFDRYMKGPGFQKWVFFLALLSITPLAYRVLTVREDLVEKVVARPELNPEDQYGYLYEGEETPMRDPRGIPKQDPIPESPAQEPIESSNTINLSGDPEPEAVQTINLSGDDDSAAEPPPPKSPAASAQPAAAKAADPCARYQKQKGWIIQDNSFSNKTFASERANALRRKGLTAEVIPKTCLGGSGEGYIVRLGATQSSQANATAQAAKFTKTLQQNSLLEGKLLVRRIN
ncbi:MAG: hypothetical protein IT260_12235 [Saprospiraceae bacterium]|nr:hypothetical protein [Saprospiraceae bacterium]